MHNSSSVPFRVLLLGTDASGKDYVAKIVLSHLQELGYMAEQRRGWFSARVCNKASSELKSPLRLLAERAFLLLYPYFRWSMPAVLAMLLMADTILMRLRHNPTLIISHTALRLLAFHMGHSPEMRVSGLLIPALNGIRKAGIRTILITTRREIRNLRIQGRIQRDKVDHFDIYMAKNPHFSDAVASSLHHITTHYLHAVELQNNDHGKSSIQNALHKIIFSPGSNKFV